MVFRRLRMLAIGPWHRTIKRRFTRHSCERRDPVDRRESTRGRRRSRIPHHDINPSTRRAHRVRRCDLGATDLDAVFATDDGFAGRAAGFEALVLNVALDVGEVLRQGADLGLEALFFFGQFAVHLGKLLGCETNC
jgi:hypothetical protein